MEGWRAVGGKSVRGGFGRGLRIDVDDVLLMVCVWAGASCLRREIRLGHTEGPLLDRARTPSSGRPNSVAPDVDLLVSSLYQITDLVNGTRLPITYREWPYRVHYLHKSSSTSGPHSFLE